MFFLSAGAAAETDPQSLSTDLPVRLKDAIVTDPGDATLQYGSRTTVGDDGRYSVRGGPALKLGLPGRFELSLAPFHQFGDASGVHGGLAGAELEWNINRQGHLIPALLVSLIRDQPYGGGHQGPHYTVQAVATKSLGPNRNAPRLGMQVNWTHTVEAAPDERDGRWLAGIVGSGLLGPHTALVVDLVHQEQNRRGHAADYLDVGFNQVLAPSLTLSGGLGPGIAQDAAAVRVFAGLRWTLKDVLPWH